MAREATTLVKAVRELREAPHNGKQPGIERLEALPCKHARVCQTQQVCIQAYALHRDATDTTLALRQRLREGGEFDVEGARQVLELNEKNLARARELMDECLQLETALRVDVR